MSYEKITGVLKLDLQVTSKEGPLSSDDSKYLVSELKDWFSDRGYVVEGENKHITIIAHDFTVRNHDVGSTTAS